MCVCVHAHTCIGATEYVWRTELVLSIYWMGSRLDLGLSGLTINIPLAESPGWTHLKTKLHVFFNLWGGHMCAYVKVREQLLGVCSLLLLWGPKDGTEDIRLGGTAFPCRAISLCAASLCERCANPGPSETVRQAPWKVSLFIFRVVILSHEWLCLVGRIWQGGTAWRC